MRDANKRLVLTNRPLAEQERDLIRWLLEHSNEGSSDTQALHAQIDQLSVISTCNCGCPSIYFAWNGKPVARKGELLVSDYLATVDDQEVGVMLFQTDNALSSLEVYSCAGSDKPFGLPAIETLITHEEYGIRRAHDQIGP